MMTANRWDIMNTPAPLSRKEEIFNRIQELRQLGIEIDEINLAIEGKGQREMVRILRQWVLDLEYSA